MQERERLAAPLPEHERVDEEAEWREGQAGERASAVPGAPGEEHERRQEGDADRPRQDREPDAEPCACEPPALGEEEREQRQQEEEGLRVRGLEEEAHREEREVEDGAPGAVRTEPFLGDPVEEQERAVAGRERDEHAREHVVAEEDPA